MPPVLFDVWRNSGKGTSLAEGQGTSPGNIWIFSNGSYLLKFIFIRKKFIEQLLCDWHFYCGTEDPEMNALRLCQDPFMCLLISRSDWFLARSATESFSSFFLLTLIPEWCFEHGMFIYLLPDLILNRKERLFVQKLLTDVRPLDFWTFPSLLYKNNLLINLVHGRKKLSFLWTLRILQKWSLMLIREAALWFYLTHEENEVQINFIITQYIICGAGAQTGKGLWLGGLRFHSDFVSS